MLLESLLIALALGQPGPVIGRESGSLPEWAVKRALAIGAATDCAGGGVEWKHTVGGSEIRVRPHKDIVLTGRDRSGTPWRVQATYSGDGGCRFLAHDLDRNGLTDLILLTANGGSGPAGVTMTIIAFDHLGRPVPWQATGPFVLEGDRILNLVDLAGDGRIELLFPYVEEYGMRGETAVHTALYTISDGFFRRTDGVFAGHRFPIERPAGVRLEDEPNLSNAVGPVSTAETISKVQPRQNTTCWLQGISLVDGGIVLASDSTASTECEGYLELRQKGKIPGPLILALDLPKEGRVIDIDYSSDEVIGQVVRLKMVVAFAGHSCETGCRPLIMWARPR